MTTTENIRADALTDETRKTLTSVADGLDTDGLVPARDELAKKVRGILAASPVEQPTTALTIPRFPTMLRKMWSGREVQHWLDKNVAPVAASDAAQARLTVAQRDSIWVAAEALEKNDQQAHAAELRAMIAAPVAPVAAAHPAAAMTDERAALLEWAVARWEAEVKNRPLINVNRRPLDDAWRQVIRHCGGDDLSLLGPRHDELLEAHPIKKADRDDARIDVEAMLRACVPAGDICDPQVVADSIREWFVGPEVDEEAGHRGSDA